MKKSDANGIRDPRKKEVIAYASKLSAFLAAKKKKAILEADLLKNNREIEYIKFGIEEAQQKIDQNRSTINEIEPKIAGIRHRLAQVEEEKRPLADEYKRLLDIQENLEKKRADIHDKESMIARLSMDVGSAAEEFEKAKEREARMLARKQEIQDEIDSTKSRLSKLKEEIEVMTTTRDLVGGQVPEFIDIEIFPSLQSGEANVEQYTSEVKDLMKNMENEIATYKVRIEESRTLEKSLSSEKKAFQKRLEEIEPKMKTGADKDRLSKEIKSLSEQKNHLVIEISENRDEIERIEPMITDLESSLETERKIVSELDKRLEYLTERKRSIAALDDIEMEMERLKGRIVTSDIGLESNRSFLGIVGRVKQGVESINKSLGASLEGYNNALEELRYIILLRHHM